MALLRLLTRQRAPDPQTVAQRLLSYGIAAEEGLLLGRYLLDAPAREVYHFNAHYLAAQLGLGWRCLSLLARAVIAGVVDLHWEARCPRCAARWQAFSSLGQAQRRQQCFACQLQFEAHLDDEIFVSFSPNPTLRALGPSADDPAWRQSIDQRYGPLTGHALLTVQAFRDLFVRDPLPRGESFEVRRIALLFSDLSGSTALYTRRGDSRAYGLVREHFALLAQLVDQAGGAVVKTIGDIMMAAFPTAQGALLAALEGQQAIAAFNQQRWLEQDEALQLKVGVHAGPCLAVTLNERLDYFGTTVNAAARVGKQARPGEVLFTAEARADLTDMPLLADLPEIGEQLLLRGLDERPFTIYRTRIS